MSGVPIDLVCTLVAESLAAWCVTANVEVASERAVVIRGQTQIRIEPASEGSMFRWLVTINGRMRPALSLLAVLRQIREALDAGYVTSRVRVAVVPLVR